MLFRAAQAVALLNERDYVMPDDVQQIAPLVLGHRLVPEDSIAVDAQQRFDMVLNILEHVAVPV